MRRRTPRVVALVAAALMAAACSSSDVADAPPDFDRYVALGDSFTAAPLVPTTDVANGCFRSDGNYPSLVAEELDVDRLVDVSCSGADTADLTNPQQTLGAASVPPQLSALKPNTDLVTLGIGGNDFNLFHTLVATCTELRREDPDGSPCAESLEARGIDLLADTKQIGTRVEAAVREIQRRAPEATVVLVGYLRLAPATGRCPELPFADGDYAQGERVARALNDALARAARRTGVEFVDMYATSEGHDVCSDDAWVNGRRTIQGEALAYHPLAEGMEAVADELVETLS